MSSITVQNTQEDSTVAALFGRLNPLEQFLTDLRERVPCMSDEQLEQGIVYAKEIEHRAFLLRGACTSQLQQRHTTRLAGGRGNTDDAGAGIESQLRRAAASIGRDVNTLRTDARIVDTFFNAPDLTQEATETGHDDATTLAAAPVATVEEPLPREFYVNALAARGQEQEAIEIAYRNRDDPTYSVRQHRSQVLALRQGATIEVAEQLYYVNVGLEPAERAMLQRLTVEFGTDQQGVMRRALRESATPKEGD